jgi:hypothetical protein
MNMNDDKLVWCDIRVVHTTLLNIVTIRHLTASMRECQWIKLKIAIFAHLHFGCILHAVAYTDAMMIGDGYAQVEYHSPYSMHH